MGRSDDLFRRIQLGGATEIDRMISEPLVEELFLDYKRAATTTPFTKLTDSDRKNLGKAICGFANSEGGIVIWGVDCRQNPPHGDVPTGAHPISDPVAFKTLIENSITGLTIPSHSGVENIAIRHAEKTEGFVVTHIPVGMNVPYRTLFEKEEYYIRAGSNFLPAPHAVLAGLFGRVPHPFLAIEVKFLYSERVANSSRRAAIHLALSIHNDGRGFAEGLYLGIEAALPKGYAIRFTMDHDQWQAWTQSIDGRESLTAVSSSSPPLPPGSAKQMITFELDVPNPCIHDIQVDITCGARNGPGAARTIKFPANVLGPAVEHRCHTYESAHDYTAGEEHHKAHIEALLRNI